MDCYWAGAVPKKHSHLLKQIQGFQKIRAPADDFQVVENFEKVGRGLGLRDYGLGFGV